MAVRIHTEAIKRLREMKHPSFVIIELANGAIVDFAESGNEAVSKCVMADSFGSKCKFYESSLSTMNILREQTGKVDVDHPKQGVMIDGLDPWWGPA